MTQTAPLTHRGTIIVDSSAFHSLYAKVSADLKMDGIKPETYLETLKFLARNGYRILIPEMIALESGITADGINIENRLFSDSKGILKDQHITLQPFLRDAALSDTDPNKETPGITIVRNTGPEAIDRHCQKVTEVFTKPIAARTEEQKIQIQRSTIIEIKRSSYQKGFGDDAIVSLASKISQDTKEKICVLTDDVDLLERIRKSASQVEEFTVRAYLGALTYSGILKHMGFAVPAGDDFVQRASQDIDQNKIAAGASQRENPFKGFSNLSTGRISHSTLLETMKAIAAEVQPSAAEATTSAPGSRARAFQDRFGKFTGIRSANSSSAAK